MDMIAFCAGVLEGEGSFITQTNKYSPVVSCQMTDEDVLNRLVRTFGCGNVLPVKKRQEHWKQGYVWKITGEDAARVMALVKPYMSKRRTESIDAALKKWYDRLNVVDAREQRALAAARAVIAEGVSFREAGKRFGISHETVRRYHWTID